MFTSVSSPILERSTGAVDIPVDGKADIIGDIHEAGGVLTFFVPAKNVTGSP